jgi:two-component system, NarL family, sensor histidine kinase UhpB
METIPELNILVVEDNPADLYLLKKMLNATSLKIHNLYATDRIGQACDLLATESIDLTLLDLSLPDSFGINSFLGIRDIAQKIPVIILTGNADTGTALEALKQGAQDYLVKGEFNGNLLSKSIQYSMERKHNLETLQESNDRFNMVTKATNDAIWDWDLQTNQILLVGDTYQKLFGFEVRHCISPKDLWEKSLHPEDKDRVLNKLKRTIKEAKTHLWEDEYRLQKADGMYAYVRDRAYILYNSVRQPIRVIGAIQDVTDKKKAAEIILSQQQYTAEAVLMAQERERTVIGEELHDNINQILSAAKLFLEVASHEPDKTMEFLDRGKMHVLTAIDEIRKLSKKLVAGNVEGMGLRPSIDHLVADLKAVKKVGITLDADDIDENQLSVSQKITIFRIIQEQLNNIVKHAQATHVNIRLGSSEGKVSLQIEDNGRGFDMKARKTGVGLSNMLNRVRLYNGKIDIDTSPGHGCRLSVVL